MTRGVQKRLFFRLILGAVMFIEQLVCLSAIFLLHRNMPRTMVTAVSYADSCFFPG